MNILPSENAPGMQVGESIEGGCTCSHVRYRLSLRPLIVHGCHCTLCQKQTGAAYAVNALIEENRVKILSGSVRDMRVTTPSGAGQTITRCNRCGVAVWSKYHALPKIGNHVLFIRAGTLNDPARMPPDVHIHTSAKQPHVILSEQTPQFDQFYDPRKAWPPDSIRRYADIITSHDMRSETTAVRLGGCV
ncbi:Glutathione-dependent formaldehyde-activating enzyme [Aliiroseovarius pelagivivens]|uniref:Glutathione-dependent formaldehyde-activating enzyme n=1 Tax=Aliiroseovarius pelagivivens TaxID=1639690 RepID=A0A2R8AIX1_9RHOB|nr:GFA family protein [Aliiroseovarius pelagivivens]SPF75991.1 Glutathione-dependent formaldehyde-activating enzyme [Aliiroseovarius pelagivivens]